MEPPPPPPSSATRNRGSHYTDNGGPLHEFNTFDNTSRGLGCAALEEVRRVCYFRMEPKTGLRLNQVDGSLCTHLILASFRIDPYGNLVVSSNEDLTYLEEVREFKLRHPRVKVMLSVSNDEQMNGYPVLASTTNDLRLKFSKSVIELLQYYKLDGVDLDWRYPNFPSNLFLASREFERQGLTKLVRALRSAIVENFYDRQLAEQHELAAMASMGRASAASLTPVVEPYLLTVAVAGQDSVLRSSYELKQLVNLCDWLNVTSYDYFLFKAYAPFTGPNSPLYPIVDPYVPILNKLALSWTVTRLLDQEELPADKIVLGIPTYARAYRLIFRNTSPAPFALAVGSRGGAFDNDCLNYGEVLELLARADTRMGFDSRARVPYLLADNGYTWITYENVQSVREKVRYILERRLGGYMTWSLNYDDFQGRVAAAAATTTGDKQQQQNGHSKASDGTETGKQQLRDPFPLHRAMLDEVALYFGPTSAGH